MRFLRLELRAYGLFTDRVLDLSDGNEGLHIVYGQNEAGKSTALSAICRLLYGFPHYTDYDFLHKSADQRVAALLKHSSGESLFIARRKGRKDTLLDEAGNPLDEHVLSPYTRGIDESLFSTLYGIGYESLVSGGRDILDQKGEIASLVFGASAGIVNVRDVLNQFGAEAAELFAPRAQKPVINDAVRRCEDARQVVRDKSLPEREWHDLAEEITQLQKRKEEFEEERSTITRERSRLERIHRAVKPVHEYLAASSELDALGSVADELITKKAAVDALREGMAQYRSARKDKPELESERDEHRNNATDTLRDVYPDLPLEKAESLRLSTEQKQSIQKLAREWPKVSSDGKREKEALDSLNKQVEDAKTTHAALPEPRDAGPLRRTVAAVRDEGNLERQRDELNGDISTAQTEIEARVTTLGRWKGDIAALEASVGRTPDIDGWSDRLRDAQSQAEQARTEAEKSAAEGVLLWPFMVAGVAGAVGITALVGMVTGIISFLVTMVVVLVSALIAGGALAFRSNSAHEKQKRQDAVKASEQQYQSLLDEWAQEWLKIGVDAGTPQEMRAWIGQRSEILREVSELRQSEAKRNNLEKRIEDRKATVRDALSELGEEAKEPTLSALLGHADDVVKRIDDDNRRREELETRIRELEKERAKAEKALSDAVQKEEAWRKRWTEAIQPLQLREDADTDFVTTVIERLDTVFAELGKAAELDRRIEQIDRTINAFEADVAELLRLLPDSPENEPADVAVTRLTERIEEISELKNRIASVRRNIDSIADGMPVDGLIAQCRDADPDALNAEITRLQEAEETVAEQLESVKEQLVEKRQEQRSYDGRAEAAEAAEEQQAILAELRGYTEKYMRLKIAEAILRDELERYRAENQGPVLERASGVFRDLTGGSFESLTTDFDDRDEQVLLGVRPNGTILGVEAMSEGTVDQLYLALRVGALEHNLAKNEPMPFIVDDVLIKFDDMRTKAALSVFAGLSEHTQVIYFTHHERIVELAEEVEKDGPGRVFIQKL